MNRIVIVLISLVAGTVVMAYIYFSRVNKDFKGSNEALEAAVKNASLVFELKADKDLFSLLGEQDIFSNIVGIRSNNELTGIREQLISNQIYDLFINKKIYCSVVAASGAPVLLFTGQLENDGSKRSFLNALTSLKKLQNIGTDQYSLSLTDSTSIFMDLRGKLVVLSSSREALNANTTLWTPSPGNYTLTSYAVEDGSFLRVNNITLGYTLPTQFVQRSKFISRLRVYATVNNLHSFTNYTGYDPEANTRRSNPLTPGIDYAAYPRSRYILAGLNMTF
ncbi:MAG: hypothetical protein EOO92_09570 [Pedobacter sp.]|nr:MAG: hypothetical protein EOO92_09570 [Pedobacter sp.]